MKIDEGCINHNAVRLISELLNSRYEIISQDERDERGYLLMTLGEIGGILEMADVMKEVLKA